MKLFYRGVSYDYDPQTPKSERISWGVDRAKQVQPSYNLSYRGVTYTVNPNVEAQKPAFAPIANLIYRGVAYTLNGGTRSTVDAVAKNLKPVNAEQLETISKLAAVHRNNLYRNLQRRLEIAHEQGDQNLIHLLERELQQIA